jgi:polyhydroxybutyrate depolymerase
MKSFGMKAVLILFVFAVTVQIKAQRIVDDSAKIGGEMRHFKMFLPENLPAQSPLVFAIHGYGGNGDVNTWMNSAATHHQFALCVPLGLADPKNVRSWNVGYPFQEGWKVNDVKTLCRMAQIVQKKYNLSKQNTFLTGMSNGGEMCYLLAYSNQTVFKALGSIAGLTLVWMYQQLDAHRTIPFLEIHGTEDRTSEWTGDLTNAGGWGTYMPVPLAVGYLVAKNRCTQELTDTVAGKSPTNGHYVIHHRFIGGTDGCEVWLDQVVGAPHCWFTDDMDTGEEVWKFFSKYLK